MSLGPLPNSKIALILCLNVEIAFIGHTKPTLETLQNVVTPTVKQAAYLNSLQNSEFFEYNLNYIPRQWLGPPF